MMNLKKLFSIVLAMMLCLSCMAFAEEESAALSYAKGDKIQDFTFTTYDGQEITLSKVLEEKEAVLINIWATWCGPCRNEFPFLEEAYEQYKDKVEVLALSCEETDDPETLAAFAAEYGLTFKIGQDNVGFLRALGLNSIPTSLVVDRFGTICFIESGSQTSVGSFTRLFDTFLGDDYTESVLLDKIPPMKPTVEAAAEADLTAALDAAATNPTDAYTWPMAVAEKDGRNVVASTNAACGTTEAAVTATVSAKAGDAIVVTFKTSTEAGCDLLNITVNGKTKVFGGEHDWMTYAVPVEADGEYPVELAYVKDTMTDGGEDMVWIDSVAVVSGDDAAAALAANPVYPVAEANALTVTNENGKEIVISDDNGLLAANFGDAKYFIVNSDTASFTAEITADVDPEGAFFYSYYDGSTAILSQSVTDGKYTFSTGVDAKETTGYTYAYVMLYLDPQGNDSVMALYFMNEENVNYFVTKNELGTWNYADGTAPSTDALPGEAVQPESTASTYIIKCVDQDGNPVAGAMMQVCDAETCQVYTTDENGEYAFTTAPYAWEVHVLMAPDGYTADSTEVVTAPAEGGEMVFTFTKN